MPNWVPLDDTSSQIGYSGSWMTVKGSSRQWEGGVHSTTQTGASAVLRFKGVGVAFRGTVPSGSGTQAFEYKIDNEAPRRVSTPQRSSDEYAVELLRVVGLPEAIHTITLTNLGGAPFQVDMLEYWPGTGDPNPAPLFPLPPQTTTARPPPPPTTPPPPPPQTTPEPTPDLPHVAPSNPTTSERTTAVMTSPSDTPVITNPETESTPNSDGVEGSLGASESTGTPSRSSPGPRTILSTDASGHVINKIIPTATERIVTTTDANGQVSTVTVVEAAPSASSLPLGAIIGIAVGAVIAVLALLIFLLLCRRRRKAKNARYVADTRQEEAGGFSERHPGYAAAHSSAELISPFRAEDPPGHTPVSSTPFWRKETHPLEDQQQPLSAVSGGFSAVTGSGVSYTGENAVVASSDPPPAYRAPTHTLTEDTFTTASGMYGNEKATGL